LKHNLVKKQLDMQTGHICALGGKISSHNSLTVHHIEPVREGGKYILPNIIYLGRLQHDMHNIIECKQYKIAREMKDYFYYFKESRDMLAREQMKTYAEQIIDDMGYEPVRKGKIYVLRMKQ